MCKSQNDKNNFISLLLKECELQNITNKNQIKYIIATVQHETNNTFKPIKEAYWLSEGWRKRNLRYYPYYGRGYVQITWRENYEKFSNISKAYHILKRNNITKYKL